jgi:hypothetical protein
VTGLAAKVAAVLKTRGYAEVSVANYVDAGAGQPSARATTEVWYRTPAFEKDAAGVADILGVGAAHVRAGTPPGPEDVAVVLGADFDLARVAAGTAVGTTSGGGVTAAEDDADWSHLPFEVKMGPPPGRVDDGLYVSLTNHTVTLFRAGAPVSQYPCATGRADSETPEGTYTVNSKLENPTWYWKGKAIPPGPTNGLGTRFIGITNSRHPKGYGLHGTNEPGSIGRDASHGCIRMTNANVEVLYEKVKAGDKVVIGP